MGFSKMKLLKTGVVLLLLVGLCLFAAGLFKAEQASAGEQPDIAEQIRAHHERGDSNELIVSLGGYDWRVLGVQDNRALLLSDKIIETKAYQNGGGDITWEKCSLREYLNGEFYNKLPDDFKALIAETRLTNDNNQWYGTSGGAATTDKIFLLSIEEAIRYFGDSGQLKNRPNSNVFSIDDQYNSARIAKDANGAASWWWLRSPGFSSVSAASVNGHGIVDIRGYGVAGSGGGLRPALWMNL